MITLQKTVQAYRFSELSQEAKDNVKDWYTDEFSNMRNDFFHTDVLDFLDHNFPNSSLSVNYSLCSCQGDGLNIEGTLNLYDYLKIWEGTPKEKRTIENYLYNSCYDLYTFQSNQRDSYSCKFIDQKYLYDTVDEIVNGLEYCHHYANINEELLVRFFTDMLDFFEDLDNKFEKDGYEYLYEVDMEEVEDMCDANEYLFTEDGEFVNESDFVEV